MSNVNSYIVNSYKAKNIKILEQGPRFKNKNLKVKIQPTRGRAQLTFYVPFPARGPSQVDS